MELHDVETFLAVVEHGGFRAASEALFLSQPSISRRVQRLEKDLGVELLERGAWGLKLNPHGEALVQASRPLRTVLESMRIAAAGASSEIIRLGAAASAAGSFLADFLTTWIPDHLTNRLHMVEGTTSALRTRLTNFECDAAILAAPVPPEFDHLPLTTVKVQALLPPMHELATGNGPMSIEALDGVGILTLGADFLATQLTEAACRISGVEPDVLYVCTVGQTLAALAEAGLGIAVVGDKTDLRGYELPRRDLHDTSGTPLEYDLHVAWARGRPLRPVLHDFIQALVEATSFRSPRPASGTVATKVGHRSSRYAVTSG